MWLLHTSNFTLHAFQGRDIPPYAILSHTWEGEEVSFQDAQSGLLVHALDRSGSRRQSLRKIRNFCIKARKFDLNYAWVDTCCIDKSSSAELSEAINSMFKWYRDSHVCLVYMFDVQQSPHFPAADGTRKSWDGATGARFQKSRWFRRGWTLQELIAPRRVHFFDHDWEVIGKRVDLHDDIFAATGLSVLAMRQPDAFSVAQRMSWASKRETTREEDMAYSLMGLFDVNMPLLYGEGRAKAFYRLQTEIMAQSTDESIFAWKSDDRETGLLAASPMDFAESQNIHEFPFVTRKHYTITHRGVQIELGLEPASKFLHFRSPLVDKYGQGLLLAGINCKRGNSSKTLVLLLLRRGLDYYSKVGMVEVDYHSSMRGSERFAELPVNNLKNDLTEIYVADPNDKVKRHEQCGNKSLLDWWE